jgi:phosphoglycolate phosphatase
MAAEMTGPTLLFDLDGTLTDPRPGIVGCLRHALARLGRPCPDDDALAACIGPPLRVSFAALLDTRDGALIEEATRLYRERYGVTGLFENRVYDGVPEMLEHLRGGRLMVATSKMAVFAERIVTHFGLAPYFSGIYGAEPGGRLDDKVELIAHLLGRERLAADTAIMIGDRAFDMVAARANGLRAVGVLWGYGSERELREAGAERLCATPVELPAVIAQLSVQGS